MPHNNTLKVNEGTGDYATDPLFLREMYDDVPWLCGCGMPSSSKIADYVACASSVNMGYAGLAEEGKKWESLYEKSTMSGMESPQNNKEGGNDMSAELNIKTLDKKLDEASKVHAKAIADAQKETKAAVEALVPKFLESQGEPVYTDEPVLIATGSVTLKDYEKAREELSLLAGDSVSAGDLSFNAMRLITSAGDLKSSKRIVSLGISY